MEDVITILHPQQALLMCFACSTFTISSQDTSSKNTIEFMREQCNRKYKTI